jgi:undecaprenyl diphosphate synthase
MNEESRDKGIHIGIIPDGSRRWARKNNIKDYDGGVSGDTTDKIVRHIFENYPEVSEISLWALSTENLSREDSDKELVYDLVKNKIKDVIDYTRMQGKEIRVKAIGSRWGDMPQDVRDAANDVVSLTKNNTGPVLNLCIGYGGREEILDATMAASRWLRKNPTIAKLHSSIFEKHLLIPRPLDIVIRTGGEKRLSGFMLYQIEYAELFFTDTLWPDFSREELDSIMGEFRERNRRFGR